MTILLPRTCVAYPEVDTLSLELRRHPMTIHPMGSAGVAPTRELAGSALRGVLDA